MKLTVVSSTQPAILSKTINRSPDGSLVKQSSAHLTLGQADLVELPGISQLAPFLDMLMPNQAVAYGVTGQVSVPLTSRKQQHKHPGAITRSEDYFSWPSGDGVMFLDYDPAEGQAPLGREQLLGALFQVCPALAMSGWAWRPSASGCVFDAATGAELEGVKGQRVYVHIADAADAPRAGAVLFARLWLAGWGRVDVAQNGALLERAIIDASVWQPSRLDFAAGAVCGPGLVRRPPAAVCNPGAPLDTRAALPDLTDAERQRLHDMVLKAKEAMKPASAAQFQRHVAAEANRRGVSAEEVEAALLVAQEKRVLCHDFVVQLAYDRGEVLVSDILAAPEKWNGVICLDPLEPDYNNRHPVGKIFADEKGFYIDSKAHGGGRVFRLGNVAALAFRSAASDGTAFVDLIGAIRIDGVDLVRVKDLLGRVNGGPFSDDEKTLLRAELECQLRGAKLWTKDVEALVYDGKPAPSFTEMRIPKAAPGMLLTRDQRISPDCWHPMHTKGKDRKPLATVQNLEVLLAAYGIGVRFNSMAKRLEVGIPWVSIDGEAVAMEDEGKAAELESLANANELPPRTVEKLIGAKALNNAYSPAADFIRAERWDGADHVGALFNEMQLEEGEDYGTALELWRRWFRGAAALGVGAIDYFEHVLVLVDPLGSAGKSRFFKTFAPAEMCKDSLILDTTNKDSVKEAISYWLVELGELDGTFRRSDAAHLKAFLNRKVDEIRLPYGRTTCKFPRRTAFVASVNDKAFLVDDSSNRRYLPISITLANQHHRVNVRQVWAQALAEFYNGFPHYFSRAEVEGLLAPRNDNYRALTVVSDLLGAALNGSDAPMAHLTCTALLKRCGLANPVKRDLNDAANWLRRNGYRQLKRNGVLGYMVPDPAPAAAAAAFQPPQG